MIIRTIVTNHRPDDFVLDLSKYKTKSDMVSLNKFMFTEHEWNILVAHYKKLPV